jgi:chaperonin cofactor prefoldin
MVKARKEDTLKELEDKRGILGLRLKSIDNQERILEEKAEKLKASIEEKLKSDKK